MAKSNHLLEFECYIRAAASAKCDSDRFMYVEKAMAVIKQIREEASNGEI